MTLGTLPSPVSAYTVVNGARRLVLKIRLAPNTLAPAIIPFCLLRTFCIIVLLFLLLFRKRDFCNPFPTLDII